MTNRLQVITGRRLLFLILVNTSVLVSALYLSLAFDTWERSGQLPIGDGIVDRPWQDFLASVGFLLPALVVLAGLLMTAVTLILLVMPHAREVVVVGSTIAALAFAFIVIPPEASVAVRLAVGLIGFLAGWALRTN